ncbi:MULTISPECIES: hypothetical protein [Anaerostipes]|uniref:hypothetical protein n=1 Tax=Anaerostipes TaxID=207244 RepID=UPI0022E4F009|nr:MULTISPECIES: hypothetical protein [Anaerostipes]WRY45887.1 hypothetical protein P8F77_09855 [Anaerostipes sp. PC18]
MINLPEAGLQSLNQGKQPALKKPDSTLMLKENHRALLVHLSDPFTVLEISQPDIVVLYREYLFLSAEKTGYTGIHRRKIMSKLRRLIQELRS